jgi:hypothetical protein
VLSAVEDVYTVLYKTTKRNPLVSDQAIVVIGNKTLVTSEISSSHGGEYDVQSCLLGCTAV